MIRDSLPAVLWLLLAGVVFGGEKRKGPMDFNQLTLEEQRIIVDKGTEPPFSGKYLHQKKDGMYVCKRCDAPLYLSQSKFQSNCGWPSFDDEIVGAVKRQMDADGMRTEILCVRCDGHLGHVFFNEGLTEKNVRHCVNSLSLDFVPAENEQSRPKGKVPAEQPPARTEKAYFAAGCFWGVEHNFESTEGVIAATSGYMGGSKTNPTYKQVCAGDTRHAEAVEVEFDPAKVSFETLAKLFFEMHNAGTNPPVPAYQYRSAVFCSDAQQKETVQKLVRMLRAKRVPVRTEIKDAATFWPAEEYHQDYYRKKGQQPTCHRAHKLFDD